MKKSKLKKIIINIAILLLFLAGIGIMIYPTFSDFMARRNYTAAITNYEDEVQELSDETVDAEIEAANAYNAEVKQISAIPFGSKEFISDSRYQELLNVGGMMGRIRIPEIDVDLPIYHGSSEEVLRKGVGHLMGTSLPVGGSGTHVSLTGHSGLPSAKLFTDLSKMVVGDVFYIDTLNLTLAYQVDQILVIEPDDIKDLQIVKDRDLVTLITCTPYGVNSHRLLVRGTRIAYEPEPGEDQRQVVSFSLKRLIMNNLLWIAAAVIVTLVVIIIVIVRRRRQRRR